MVGASPGDRGGRVISPAVTPLVKPSAASADPGASIAAMAATAAIPPR